MLNINEKSKTRKDSISVEFFYEKTKRLFKLKLLSKSCDLTRKIYDQNYGHDGK